MNLLVQMHLANVTLSQNHDHQGNILLTERFRANVMYLKDSVMTGSHYKYKQDCNCPDIATVLLQL